MSSRIYLLINHDTFIRTASKGKTNSATAETPQQEDTKYKKRYVFKPRVFGASPRSSGTSAAC